MAALADSMDLILRPYAEVCVKCFLPLLPEESFQILSLGFNLTQDPDHRDTGRRVHNPQERPQYS